MKKSVIIFFTIITLGISSLSAQSVIVNELQAANVDMFVDPSFNYGTWVELYNPTDKLISLSGWYVSDDPNNLTKHKISGTIRSKGFKVLWFDHYSKEHAPNQIDDKLDYDGGIIYISDKDGNLVCSQPYPEAISRTSYARTTDGGNTWGVTSQPTPGKSNHTSIFATERLDAPVVNRDGGIFRSQATVRVSIPEGTTLRYTTDGTTPTEKNGTVSNTGLFTVKSTQVFRFRLFKEGYLPSRVVTRSYIITTRAYNMPVVSVVTDPVNLYDDSLGIMTQGVNGIPGNGYDTPCNWNMEWERPANFEYFTTEGDMVVNQETTIERCGGWSRAWLPYSFKVKANKIYEGENYIPYQFFPNKAYLKHRTLQLRNGGNDNNSRIKDPALQAIVHTSGLDVDGQECRPAVHYVNGVYKGLINIREPNNKHFVEANYALDDDEIDQFEITPGIGYNQKCGTDESFLHWGELSVYADNPEKYAEICSMVDIDEYINYMAVELYLGSDDWPQNNAKAYKPIREGGKFRFVLFDLDHSFNLTSETFTTFANKRNESRLVGLFLNMLKNTDFRKQFIDTFCLLAGSVYVPERCNAIIDSMAQNTETVLSYENKSPWWTANEIKTKLSNRQAPMIAALKSFSNMKLSGVTEKKVSFMANIPHARLSVNGIPVPTNKFSGSLFGGVKLKAEAPAGYRFIGWRSPKNIEKEIFGKESSWHYYDQGSMDGKSWKSSVMNSWSSGKAPLGYYTGDTNNSRGHNTKLNYGSDANNKRPTYYFSKEFTLDHTPSSADVYTLNYAVDDGMVVYINGKEAARYQMNNGTVSYNTFASTHAAGNPDNGSLILPSNLFKKGTNVIAVEVHNNNGTSTDIHFDAALYASVLSTDDKIYSEEEEFILPAGNNFSLVACYEPLTVEEEQQNHQVPVRINEISADNGIYVNANYFERNDWIELYNTTSRQVDVAGMYLTDKLDQPQKFQIPANEKVNTIIPPYGYLIIWADKLDPIHQLHASFKLDKEGGSVMLTSADEAWSDTLFYPAHAEYESVGLYPDGGTNMYVMPYPTIAATNEMSSLAQFFIESELSSSVTPMDAPERQLLYATYADGQLIVRGKQDAAISIALYTVSGQRVTQTTAILTAGQATLPVGNLSSGIYIVRLNDSQGNTHNQKMVVR
jgi:hypothetical protein